MTLDLSGSSQGKFFLQVERSEIRMITSLILLILAVSPLIHVNPPLPPHTPIQPL